MGLRTKRKTENASPGPCTGALCPLAGLASCCCRAVESFATTVIYRNSCLSHTYTNLPSFTWRVWVVHESLIFLLLYYTKQDLTMQRFMSFTCIRQMQENHRSLVVLPHRAQTMYISQTKYTGTHMHAPSVLGVPPLFYSTNSLKLSWNLAVWLLARSLLPPSLSSLGFSSATSSPVSTTSRYD
jgi:hypothetical protein